MESADETASALEQWLFAERPREALRLLAARSTELYDRGREATILRTIEAIPREVVAADVDSLIDFAVSHILVPRSRLVEAVRQATWHAEHYGPTTASAQIAALRSVSLAMEGDWTSAGTLAQQALAELGDTWWEAPPVVMRRRVGQERRGQRRAGTTTIPWFVTRPSR